MAETSAQPISLGAAAYRRLRLDIVSCQLAPGVRFTERQLVAATGFGISPLREALTRLDHEGLIRTLPRKGYQVTPVTLKLIDDVFAVFEIVCPDLVRLGIERASDDELTAVSAGFAELAELENAEPCLKTALRYHDIADATFATLLDAVGNDYLRQVTETIWGAVARIWTLLLTSDSDALRVNPYMAQIQRASAKRDGDAAADAARHSIRNIHRYLRDSAGKWPSVMQSEVIVSLPGSLSPEIPTGQVRRELLSRPEMSGNLGVSRILRD